MSLQWLSLQWLSQRRPTECERESAVPRSLPCRCRLAWRCLLPGRLLWRRPEGRQQRRPEEQAPDCRATVQRGHRATVQPGRGRGFGNAVAGSGTAGSGSAGVGNAGRGRRVWGRRVREPPREQPDPPPEQPGREQPDLLWARQGPLPVRRRAGCCPARGAVYRAPPDRRQGAQDQWRAAACSDPERQGPRQPVQHQEAHRQRARRPGSAASPSGAEVGRAGTAPAAHVGAGTASRATWAPSRVVTGKLPASAQPVAANVSPASSAGPWKEQASSACAAVLESVNHAAPATAANRTRRRGRRLRPAREGDAAGSMRTPAPGRLDSCLQGKSAPTGESREERKLYAFRDPSVPADLPAEGGGQGASFG